MLDKSTESWETANSQHPVTSNYVALCPGILRVPASVRNQRSAKRRGGEKKEREKKEKEKEKGKRGEGGKNSIRSIRRLTMKREGETSGDRGDVCVRLKVG